ncbi:helix-turn-helix domain-containing protein [Candidatus Saccharibacteria bacterium]|nr:helix-turn-helix domain-containing protein [Candidatus Saccharibacteria bacterium]
MQIFIDGKEVLSVNDTAKRFNVTVKTVYVWLHEKSLRSVMNGRRRFITLESIVEFEKLRGA